LQGGWWVVFERTLGCHLAFERCLDGSRSLRSSICSHFRSESAATLTSVVPKPYTLKVAVTSNFPKSREKCASLISQPEVRRQRKSRKFNLKCRGPGTSRAKHSQLFFDDGNMLRLLLANSLKANRSMCQQWRADLDSETTTMEHPP